MARIQSTRGGSSAARQQGGASLWAYRNLIWNFAQRDLKTRFKGTALGWSWSLVVPLASLLIYSVVFSLIFKAPPPPFGNGKDGVFPVWLFAGLVVWGFFSNSINMSIGTLMATGPLLKKIFFPAYAPVVGSVIATGLQSMIELGLLAVVLIAYANVGWTWLLLPFWAGIFAVFVAGISTALAVLNVYYRDLAHIVSVALQLFFYLTPIIFPLTFEALEESWHGISLRDVFELNPLTAFVQLFRDLIYGLTPGTGKYWAYAFVWAGLAAAIGAWVYQRKGRDLGEEL